jgi:C-terminal processing protease CtpA/Prc
MRRKIILLPIILVLATTLSCGLPFNIGESSSSVVETEPAPTEVLATSTPLPAAPVQAGEENPDEPVFISGSIPYTSPFFINTISQPFVMLEDQAGFVQRDKDFMFPINGQVLGPVVIHEDESLTYSLHLPTVPQGTMVDVDNNGGEDAGVQIFAIAYWSNTWGDTFLEKRDGTGWSTAYASTLTNPANQDEITGGTLVVWAPDDQQSFPTGFGPDGLLFTEDDPVDLIPAGYNIVNLDQEPFQFTKSGQPEITLNEGVVAVNDFKDLSYSETFRSLFDKVSREYPFTVEKGIDWDALDAEFTPRVESANSSEEFYLALKEFTLRIPDGHANMTFNPDVYYQSYGGSFGMVLAKLSDGRVIVTDVLPNTPAFSEGIQVGAEITTWNGQPVTDAMDTVTPFFGPYSTEHTLKLAQVNALTRVPPESSVDITYRNPDAGSETQTSLRAAVEYETLLMSFPNADLDQLALPLEGEILDESGIAYVRLTTFSDDYQLMARLWDHYIQGLIDEEVPGLIIDLRANGGGSLGLAMNFAGYFFDQEIPLYQSYYYSEQSGEFEETDRPTKIEPGPLLYEGKVALLVSPDCVSACEGFAYAMQTNGRSSIIGHYPTAGAFGEVGRGQYELPDEINMQFPTGRPESLDNNELVIEGTGVIPDLTIPVTEESALGLVDTLLEAAIQELTR